MPALQFLPERYIASALPLTLWFVQTGNNPRLARRLESIAAMFLGAALGAVVIHYSISAALWLATAISAVCSAALFLSLRTSDKL